MRNFPIWIVAAAMCCIPAAAAAHTGGPLDPDGCHADHRTSNYHCHRGAAAGYTFPNRAAMEEAVRTGVFPDKTVDVDGFFSKLWPWGKHREEVSGDGASKSDNQVAPSATAGATAPAKQSEPEKRLKVLQGLYEMGLITKEEYEAKRQAVLDQL